MFFDNIGADLHFVHEAETGCPEARRIFSSYQNAAQCYGKDKTTCLAAFLLNEHGRVANVGARRRYEAGQLGHAKDYGDDD